MPADYADIRLRVQVETRGNAVRWRDALNLKVLPCRVVALAFDVGLPRVRRREDGVVWSLELGQVPAQPLVTADDATAPGTDYDQALLLKGLQSGARGLAADVVVAG